MLRFLASCVTLAVVLAACSSDEANRDGDGTMTRPQAETLTVDCLANGPCPEIRIGGDPPATLSDGRASNVRGYAGPSLERDPATGALWMAYSWPHVAVSEMGGVAVESHLAPSADGGATWTFVRKLWTSFTLVDDLGRSGHMNQETVSLAVRESPSGNVCGIQPGTATSALVRPAVRSFTVRVATASSPELLADADEAILGGDLTQPFWKPDVNLASLSDDLRGCTFHDPGIVFHDGNLFLGVQCNLYTQSGESPEREFVALFVTDAQGPARSWSWRYLGKLATREDAVELGGENLLQTDLVKGRDGALLAIFSPSAPASPLGSHFGCRVVEIESLDPPRLARDGSGKLRLRASVTATDLLPRGPAACTYDPASSTGVVVVRRILGGGQLIVSLHSTGIQP